MTEKHLAELARKLRIEQAKKAQIENNIESLKKELDQELAEYDEQTRLKYIAILLRYFLT